VGAGVGVLVGAGVGVLVGIGVLVGAGTGVLVGAGTGVLVGAGVGVLVGAGTGVLVGAGVGVLVGTGVGVLVGTGIGVFTEGVSILDGFCSSALEPLLDCSAVFSDSSINILVSSLFLWQANAVIEIQKIKRKILIFRVWNITFTYKTIQTRV